MRLLRDFCTKRPEFATKQTKNCRISRKNALFLCESCRKVLQYCDFRAIISPSPRERESDATQNLKPVNTAMIKTQNTANESKTEWKTLIVPASLVEDYTERCYLLHMPNHHSSCQRFIYISKKLVRFIGGKKARISYLPNMTWLAKGCIYREMTAEALEQWFSSANAAIA